MKKSAFSFLFVVLFAVMMFVAVPSVSRADSVSLLTSLLTGVVDKAVAKKETSAEKISVLKLYQMLFTSPEFSASKNQKIYAAVAKYITEEITVFQTLGTVWPEVPNVAMEIANVDVQRVRDTVLAWHNAERANVGADAYVYERDLEATAQTWANHLNATATTASTHVRTVGDGSYNYEKIMEWFSELGVTFPVLTWGRSAFSESIGRGYYTCSASDCTQVVLDAIKTTWDFFMSEKKSKGSHYKAIVMEHFTQLGIGISIDPAKKRYYLVVHYGVELL